MDRAQSGDLETPRHVIFDLGAGEITRFSEMVEKEGLFQRMHEEGHTIRFVVPLDGSTDSFAGIKTLIEDTSADGYLGPYGIDVSVFLNAALGANAEKAAANRVALVDLKRDFPSWINSALRTSVTNAGWAEVQLPVLESTTAYSRWSDANRSAADASGKLQTMAEWMRMTDSEARRDQFQMTRWHNRLVRNWRNGWRA